MTPSKFFSFLVFIVSCLPSLVVAQSSQTERVLKLDAGKSSPEATIGQVAWIAGHWKGEAFGGKTEEVWSKPEGNAMMGMFRLVQDNEAGFYELMTLVEEAGSIVFRLKHFNADLTGWEEQNETVTFPLVKLEGNMAFFDGITFHRVDDHSLDIFVATENKEGGLDELAFNYKR